MIKIFYCNSSDDTVPNGISSHRYNKIISAKKDRQAMINAARVLAAGFADLGISESEVRYGFGASGKPFAVNFPHIHFSLAHSENFSIVAFYDNEMGIDCENISKNIPPEITKRYFSPDEAEAFYGDELSLWVAKEALVKYTGEGFAKGRDKLEIPFFDDELDAGQVYFKKLLIDGYLCVLCSHHKDEIIVKKI